MEESSITEADELLNNEEVLDKNADEQKNSINHLSSNIKVFLKII